jgi:hypothetical protein
MEIKSEKLGKRRAAACGLAPHLPLLYQTLLQQLALGFVRKPLRFYDIAVGKNLPQHLLPPS